MSYFRSRFILNLPEEELVSFERISFQVEQAYVDDDYGATCYNISHYVLQ